MTKSTRVPQRLPTAFVAYPSRPKELPETIQAAVNQINDLGTTDLRTWEQMQISGNVIISEICREIDEADYFVADLTHSNANVLFELGFAIAKSKPLWLLLDSGISQKKFAELGLLTSVGYSPYVNAEDLVSSFHREQPHRLEKTPLLENLIANELTAERPGSILYIKSLHNTETNRRISKRVQRVRAGRVIVDDHTESPNQTLVWYARHVLASEGILCCLDDPERPGATLRNARSSLVSGLAFGFQKPILMLAPEAFRVPLDYRELLYTYESARAAVQRLEGWLAPREDELRQQSLARRTRVEDRQRVLQLQALDIGEYIAEHEQEELVHGYFVETAAYREARAGRQTLFVGRKGTGKTANFLQLADELAADARNSVAVIRPVAYELEAVVRVLSRFANRDEKIYAVEALWKLLLYTEIAGTIWRELREIDPAARRTEDSAFIDFCEKHTSLVGPEFAVRLESVIAELEVHQSSAGHATLVSDNRDRTSEILHSTLLRKFRDHVLAVSKHKSRVAIVVDNLDKSWSRSAELGELSEFLLGLLSAANRLRRDLTRKSTAHTGSLEVTMTVFLRADIFERVRSVAREPDKITSSRVEWDDPEILFRIAEERYLATQGDGSAGSDLWERYFCGEVKGVRPQDYIAHVALPRPRDFLYFLKSAIDMAVNRRHSVVEEEDILAAEREYSQFACEVILVEDTLKDGLDLEGLLLEFVGCTTVLSEADVHGIIAAAAVPAEQAESVMEQLCWLGFLQPEVANGEFRSPRSSNDYRRLQTLARRLAERRGDAGRSYQVHAAFRRFLDIGTR